LLWLGQRDIPRTLRALGVWRVRTIILSHPNLDHYAAIPDIIGPFGVREVLVGEATIAAAEMDPAGPVAHLLEVLDRQKVSVRVVRAGDSLKIGTAQLEFIHPRGRDAEPSANDQSLVALVRVPTAMDQRRVLFTGDIGRDAIKKIELAYPDLRVDVVEAPHHGSAQPRAIQFVNAIDPAIVIQSTGPSRVNDARWSRVREGRAWFTTASDGAIRVIIRTDGELEATAFARKDASQLSEGSERAKDKSQ
jgi:competence protein ComEC